MNRLFAVIKSLSCNTAEAGLPIVIPLGIHRHPFYLFKKLTQNLLRFRKENNFIHTSFRMVKFHVFMYTLLQIRISIGIRASTKNKEKSPSLGGSFGVYSYSFGVFAFYRLFEPAFCPFDGLQPTLIQTVPLFRRDAWLKRAKNRTEF